MDSSAERPPAQGARSAGCPGTHAGEPGRGRQTYVRRQPEQSVLHGVMREHLETFLAEARGRGGGDGVPRFVERELREFLTLPFRLRYRLAYDHRLCRAVLAVRSTTPACPGYPRPPTMRRFAVNVLYCAARSGSF
jgi:hypothetical protein